MMIERPARLEVKPVVISVRGFDPHKTAVLRETTTRAPAEVEKVLERVLEALAEMVRVAYPKSDPRDLPLVGTLMEYEGLKASDYPEVKVTPHLTLAKVLGSLAGPAEVMYWEIQLSVVAFAPVLVHWHDMLELLHGDVVTSMQLSTEAIDITDDGANSMLPHTVLRPEVAATGAHDGVPITIMLRMSDRVLLAMSTPETRQRAMQAVDLVSGELRDDETFDAADWEVFYPPDPDSRRSAQAAMAEMLDWNEDDEITYTTTYDHVDDDEGDHLPDFSMN